MDTPESDQSPTDFNVADSGVTSRGELSQRRRVLVVLTTSVTLLAAAAFTLSFDALRALAVASGVTEGLALLWPLIVDGFICVATVAAVLLRPRGWRIAWYPWATLAAAAFVSVSGNALHARAHADLTVVSATTAALVSAVPPIALLSASHMLVVLLAPPVRGSRGAPPPAQHLTPTYVPPSTPRRRTGSTRRPTDEELRAWIVEQAGHGDRVTGEMVAVRYGVSPATGRRWLQAERGSKRSRFREFATDGAPGGAVNGVRR